MVVASTDAKTDQLALLGTLQLRDVRQMQALNPRLEPNHIEIGLRLHDSTRPLPDEKKHERIVGLRK